MLRAALEAAGYEVSTSPPVQSDAPDFWRMVRIVVDDEYEAPRIAVLAFDLIKAGNAPGVEEVVLLGSRGEELRRVSVKGSHWRHE